MTSKKIPEKWQKENASIKAVQVAFDLGEEVQFTIRSEALKLGVTPSDRVRTLLGLPVHSRPQRPRLSISLSPADFKALAKRFGLDSSDRTKIRQRATELLVSHTTESSAELERKTITQSIEPTETSNQKTPKDN